MAAPPALLALALALSGVRGAGAGDCKGQRRVLRGPSGFVTDGPGNYSVNGNCEWLVEAPSPRHRVLLTFTFMDTECTYDYLFVYDGDSPRSPLLASLSGSTLPAPLEATSGKMLLHLFSDANYNLLGFNATYSVSLCPRGCSGRGGCDPQGRCQCQPGWGGPDCAQPHCATYCQAHGGTCNQATGRCECRLGFVGQACDLALGENRGGRPLVQRLDLNTALGDLVVYNFTTNRWLRLELTPAPAPRHSHVAVCWRDALVLSGGELAGGTLARDVWVFDPFRGGWRELHPQNGTRPPGLAGHAAALVDDWLYIFGGRTAEDVFSSQLFRFHLETWAWERVVPWGGEAPRRRRPLHGLPPPLPHPPRLRGAPALHRTVQHAGECHRPVPRGPATLDHAAGPGRRPRPPRTRLPHRHRRWRLHGGLRRERAHPLPRGEVLRGRDLLLPPRLPPVGPQRRAGPRAAPWGPGGPQGRAAMPTWPGCCGAACCWWRGASAGPPAATSWPTRCRPSSSRCQPRTTTWTTARSTPRGAPAPRTPSAPGASGGARAPRPTATAPAPAAWAWPVCWWTASPAWPSGGPGRDPPAPPAPSAGACRTTPACLWPSRAAAAWGRSRGPTAGGARAPSLSRRCSTAAPPTSCPASTSSPTSSPATTPSPTRSPSSAAPPSRSAPAATPMSPSSTGASSTHCWAPPRPPAPAPASGPASSASTSSPASDGTPTPPSWRRWGAGRCSRSGRRVPCSARAPSGFLGHPSGATSTRCRWRGTSTARAAGRAASSPSSGTAPASRGAARSPSSSWSPSAPPRGAAPPTPPAWPAWPTRAAAGAPPAPPATAACTPRGGSAEGEGPAWSWPPANCVLCEDYRDCHACAADPFCEWQAHSSKKGDFVCSRRGRQAGAVRAPQHCPSLCSQRRSCAECLSNSSQCAWCQSTRSCFFFAAYLAKYPYGDCRGWYDSVHSAPQCLDCSRFNTCRECLQNLECGWCGDADNPTLGRCLEGDFSGLRGYPNCSSALGEPGGLPPGRAAAWSYGQCPDVDECRLGMAACHPFAACHNTPQAFECRCRRGYAGDGTTHCKPHVLRGLWPRLLQRGPQLHLRLPPGLDLAARQCHHPRGHGGGTLLGTQGGDAAALCSVDCGCHFHSSCEMAGPGVCDRCQNWTHGERCQLCRPGSFGDATGPGGCRQCQCHGHGRPERGHCHGHTGACFCAPPTEGPHCERCAPGYFGDPRDRGTCYRECGGRSLLANLSSPVALGSRLAGGGPAVGGGLSYCVWGSCQPRGAWSRAPPGRPCPPISLTLQPDLRTPCMNSYAYAFDGVPAFLDSGVLQGDPTLLGAFCGHGRPEPLTLEAHSGVLVLYYEANGSEPTGFNASVGVQSCRPPCPGGQECRGGPVRLPGWARGPWLPPAPLPWGLRCPRRAGGLQHEPGALRLQRGLRRPRLLGATGAGQHRLGDPHRWAAGGRHGQPVPAPPGPQPGGGAGGDALDVRGALAAPGAAGKRLQVSRPRPRPPWPPRPPPSRLPFTLPPQILHSRAPLDADAGGGRRMGGPGPSPRYFHAAAPLPARRAMLVLGGLTAAGVASDAWVLNLTTLQWRQEQDPLLPAVAGHTLTPRRGTSLLLIGGVLSRERFQQEAAGVPGGDGELGGGAAGRDPPHRPLRPLGCLPRGHGRRLRLRGPPLPRGDRPLPHFFHAAAVVGDVMVVLGGRTETHDFSNQLLLYQLRCNAWVLPPHTEPAVVGEPMNQSVAHAVAVAGGRVYVSGGFNGVALGRLSALRLPTDPCLSLPGPEACNRSGAACAWCHGSCLSADAAQRLGCAPGPAACAPSPRSPEDCRRLRTCSECLAQHPRALRQGPPGEGAPPQCKWCTNCPEGACIGSGGSCTSENDCRINQREIFAAANCSEVSCEASDCPKCTASGKCMWTRQFKRTGETRRILSVQPTYDWTCFSHSLLNVSPMPVESSPPLPCPTPCHNHSSCPLCLASKGADGGWQHCVWSVSLQQCMSPSYVPLRCAAGACGRLLRGGRELHPGVRGGPPSAPAASASPAAAGAPAAGTTAAAAAWRAASTAPATGWRRRVGRRRSGLSWAAPPENECLNGHHDCNETQDCRDLPHGYRCACKSGYTLDNATGLCRPVCEQGCVNGTCVEPNRCRCHFGYCLQCFNNTKGPQCERCRPLFVGSARAGGSCRPCRSFCRHNAAVCISREEYERARRDPARFPLEPAMIPTWVSEGPSEEAAVCVNCQNNSVGERCDGCRPGFFLLDGACTKCQLQWARGTRATSWTGRGCPCQNNTETGSCQGSSPADKKDCYKQQCAKCRDSFHGHPSNCFHQPQLQHLGPGRTVLFGVQPKFTNVDIRITLDVTFGGVDLFVSTAYDTFAVDVDPATGRHVVRLQTPHPAGAANTTRLREERAAGLVTYLTDQAHIDLFVFFSVFFSCFFLFLALCVLLWKAKQGLDARHEQRRHLQEMSKMASRPFAKQETRSSWAIWQTAAQSSSTQP
ncbi:unnamed protein product [Bubo scandiacus]